RQAGIESVTITTRKPPKSIKGAPYLSENNIDVEGIKEETVIFEGNALDAIKGFPKNINVSALLSIAGIGPEKTRVKIVVSPEYTRNTHEIEVKSKAGTIKTRTENVPSPDNPKTSYLAALAAIASLRGYFDSIKIGT
ncbi:MAG: aspartate dehydrogenase domain-containing protein, partial [Candidatus Omnitrophota bacterium]